MCVRCLENICFNSVISCSHILCTCSQGSVLCLPRATWFPTIKFLKWQDSVWNTALWSLICRGRSWRSGLQISHWSLFFKLNSFTSYDVEVTTHCFVDLSQGPYEKTQWVGGSLNLCGFQHNRNPLFLLLTLLPRLMKDIRQHPCLGVLQGLIFFFLLS